MYIEYTTQAGPQPRNRDLIKDALGETEGDIDKDLKAMGYMTSFDIGNREVAAIQLYNRWSGEAEFAAIAMVTLGETIDFYAFPTTEDAWDYLHKAAPTVKAISELSQMKFD
ncbi:hypothetical protein HBN82_23810 [Pseudomonas lundensis]|uniref:hypothetical protein n=1 Tax=Pseudomonas lundensis TaxID=86185 RepID=UPI001475DCC6|nr:hypothetical protein [Pseudomonas lundensis]NNA18871.1 hypothetical protein [Pseudomonas lundensis]